MKSTYKAPIERGILTSAYKNEIKQNIRNAKLETLANMRLAIDAYQEKFQNQAVVSLKISVFALCILSIIL